jgi:hypothetical protein
MQFVVIGKDRATCAAPPRRSSRTCRGAPGPHPLCRPADRGRADDRQPVRLRCRDRGALDAYLAADPYFADGGIFETVEIYESRKMGPESEPGFLVAEAERARARDEPRRGGRRCCGAPAAAVAAQPLAVPAGYRLVWSDEFSRSAARSAPLGLRYGAQRARLAQ